MDDYIHITKKSKYWIYTLDNIASDEFIKYTGNIICFDKINYIKKNDIIILFEKNKSKNIGFFCILVSNSIAKKSTIDNHIFSNNDQNNFYIELKYKNFFNPVKIQTIISILDVTSPIFNKSYSFRNKFLKNSNTLTQLQLYGKEIFTILLNIHNSYKQEENSKEENDNVTNKDIQIYNIKNYIPIIIVPCKSYNYSKIINKKCKYFVDHYKTCNNCEITNNNNRELCSIINNANIEFIELKDENDNNDNNFLDNILEYYYKQQIYIIEDITTSFIKVIFINNNHNIYNRCLLILWSDI